MGQEHESERAPLGSRAGRDLAGVLLLLGVTAGCGSTEPDPVTAMPPAAPADLCATVPGSLRTGLVAASDSDPTGQPTAACSLRSAFGARPEVRAVVTWLEVDGDDEALDVLASQCRSIDRSVYRVQPGFTARGADRACAGSGSDAGADAATLAASDGREVVTVRLRSEPAGPQPSLARGRQVLEGVLAGVARRS